MRPLPLGRDRDGTMQDPVVEGHCLLLTQRCVHQQFGSNTHPHVQHLHGCRGKIKTLDREQLLNVPRLRHPRTLIFPVHRASVGFSMPVLVLTNVSGLWMITSSAGAASLR